MDSVDSNLQTGSDLASTFPDCKSEGNHVVYRAPAVTWPILFTPPCWQPRTAGSQYEMNGASISFKATEFTAHFNSKDIDLYIAKPYRLNITDHYNALGVLLTCINIWTDRFPDLQYPELPHQLYLLTLLRRLFKSLQKPAGYKWTQSNFLISAKTTDCKISSLEG